MVRTHRRLGIALTLAVPLCLLGLLGRPAPAADTDTKPFRFPEGKAAHGELKYRNDLPVLVVSGTPEEMGDAVGALALKPSQRMVNYPRELLKMHGGDKLYNPFVAAGLNMAKHFPDNYRAEMDEMARSAGVDRNAVVMGNTFFDLKKIFACSALLVEPEKSATGGPLLARNLDYPSLGYVHQHSLVTVYRPKGKHAFVSVGFPGLVGCLSGMNDAGLSVAILEVFQVKDGEPSFDAEGLPYALCYRKILEECTTIDEAYKLLCGLRRVATTNLVVADRNGVAVFEVAPGRVERRKAEGGLCPCTNHFCTPKLGPEETVNVTWTLDRFATLRDARNDHAKFGPDDLRQELDKVHLGDLTMQTMVFEPRTLKLHLAVGELPASKGRLHTLDLGPLFKGE
jgi:isopenicillin-N N-acyltransferase like protein